ncbi:MAG: hypothetical protein WCL71_18325, partial [Deltaproteobacteria bacterium]
SIVSQPESSNTGEAQRGSSPMANLTELMGTGSGDVSGADAKQSPVMRIYRKKIAIRDASNENMRHKRLFKESPMSASLDTTSYSLTDRLVKQTVQSLSRLIGVRNITRPLWNRWRASLIGDEAIMNFLN